MTKTGYENEEELAEVEAPSRLVARKQRIGSEDAIMKQRGYGDEPSWENINITDADYNMRLMHALTWANRSFNAAMLKQISIDYMLGNTDYTFFKEVPDYFFLDIGKQAWLRMSKAPTTKQSDMFFNTCLEELKVIYKNLEAEKQKEKEIIQDIAPKLTVDKSAKIEYVGLYSYFDHLIAADEIDADKVYDLVRSRSPSQQALRALVEHYKSNIAECDDFSNSVKLKGKAKKVTKALHSGSRTIVTVLEKILSNVRAESKLNKIRRPRKRKIKPAQMQIKNLKFKESDSALKLVSIPPTAIIAAPTLITFNTRTRKVAIYYAKNTDGLFVKGTTIQNYDTEKSKMKMLRKPEEMIDHLVGTSLHRFEKVFGGIKAVQGRPNGRINEDTMLLKVFKL
jgi:hypothetical protein